jgi:RNA polymerase sigma-70 factor (ECF subfamily)
VTGVRDVPDVPEPDERSLVEGLRRGEAQAFDVVYVRYRARVYAFLVRLAGRTDVAEDLFQETWLKLARHARRLEPGTDLAAWLFTVARNAWRSHRRWALFDVSRLVALGALGEVRDPPPTSDAPHGPRRVDAARRVERLERALSELPPALREVVLLVVVEGLSQEEAARVIGITYDALRQRLARARARLAAALEPPDPAGAST